MKNAHDAIERLLELRFGKMEAQAVKFGRARLTKIDVQFSHIKQMAELCERYRNRARMQILAYRLWRETQALLTQDPLVRLYGAAEGAALHRRLSDDVRLWYFAHRDYHQMRKAFIEKCMSPQIGVAWKEAS